MKEDALISAQLPFGRLDACPVGVLNAILWRSAKGATAPFPGWAEGHEEEAEEE